MLLLVPVARLSLLVTWVRRWLRRLLVALSLLLLRARSPAVLSLAVSSVARFPLLLLVLLFLASPLPAALLLRLAVVVSVVPVVQVVRRAPRLLALLALRAPKRAPGIMASSHAAVKHPVLNACLH